MYDVKHTNEHVLDFWDKNNFDLTKLNKARTYIIDVDFSFKDGIAQFVV